MISTGCYRHYERVSLAIGTILVKTVDYVRDAGEAGKSKSNTNSNSPTDKNLIIFDCEGRTKIANGKALIQYAPGEISKDKRLEFRLSRFVRDDVHLDTACRHKSQAAQGIFFGRPWRTITRKTPAKPVTKIRNPFWRKNYIQAQPL